MLEFMLIQFTATTLLTQNVFRPVSRRNKRQSSWIRMYIFFREIALENVSCKMVVILLKGVIIDYIRGSKQEFP